MIDSHMIARGEFLIRAGVVASGGLLADFAFAAPASGGACVGA
jgi:hypothetical protein